MKNRRISPVLTLLLVLSLLVGITTICVSAVNEGFAETAEWLNANPNYKEDYAFSLAVVGDTQTLVEADVNNGTAYTAEIYKWIIANKDARKMQYVLGMGDITQNNTDEEWAYAKSVITTMNGEIPYLLNRGAAPHDTAAKFDQYFASEEGYTSTLTGFYKEGEVSNTYTTFAVGDCKYLVFALEFAAVDEVLAWAGEIIESEEYKDHRVIITTHSYLFNDGTTLDQNENVSSIPDKKEYTSDDRLNNGDELWDKFVSKHENIFLILSGHITSSNIVASQVTGDNGNVVTQMLINPQSFDYNQQYQTGMVCMLYFSADGNDVSVEWYSTIRDQYYRQSNQFDISLDELCLTEGVVTEYGFIPSRNYDPENYPFAVFKKKESVVDGVTYDYTLVDCYKTLSGDSSKLATGNDTRAYHIARNAGDGAVILMLRDVTNTDDYAYSNLQYHPGSLTLDLGGFTMTDNHTHTTGLFYSYMKSANNIMEMTVKNGDILLSTYGLTSYGAFGGRQSAAMKLKLENVNIGFSEGATANYLVGKYAQGGEYSGCFPVTFDGCEIDMKNAPDGTRIVASGSGETVTVVNSKIVNSKLSYHIDKYGYSDTAPTEDDYFAIYMKKDGTKVVDGVTYPSEYTHYAYSKALTENTNRGVSTNDCAYGKARYVTENLGYEALILMLKDYEDDSGYKENADGSTGNNSYSNLCYNGKDVVFDLGGHILTDAHTHHTTLFYVFLKSAAKNSTTMTVKNGSWVFVSSGLVNFSIGNANVSFTLKFEDVDFSFAEGSGVTNIIGANISATQTPLYFNNCTFDLENAKSTIKLSYTGTLDGIHYGNTIFYNSKSTYATNNTTNFPTSTGTQRLNYFDGNYIIDSEYGIVPLKVADREKYPFASYKKETVTIDGVNYDYRFFSAYEVFANDSVKGVATDKLIAVSGLRWCGDGAVLYMRRDYTDFGTGVYNNYVYNTGTVTIDFGGHTFTDEHTYTQEIFYFNDRKSGYSSTLVFKNGDIILGTHALVYCLGGSGSQMHVGFENVGISFKEGSVAKKVVYTTASKTGQFSAYFTDCIIDLENAPESFNLTADKQAKDVLPITLTRTELVNSQVIKPEASITLGNDFILNLYVPTAVGSSMVEITSVELGGIKCDIADIGQVSIGGVSYYKLMVAVAPNSAMDNQNAVVYINHTYTYYDDTTKVTATSLDWEISVVSYLEKLIALGGEENIALAKDALSYIRAAYVYENEAEDLEGILSRIDALLGEGYDGENEPLDIEAVEATEGMTSVKLLLDYAPAFIFYPEVDSEGELVFGVEKYSFALDGKYRLDAEAKVDGEGRTCFVISLPAWAFDNTVEYVIEGEGIHGYYNIGAYYEFAKGEGDEALVVLIERLIRYAETAEAYRNI